jgi:hypothetical protein
MVTNDSVEKACLEVEAFSDERMASEFDLFFREQPAICEFVMEVTTESPPDIQELSLFLAYMVFKAAKLESNGASVAIPADRIEAAYHESESWIDRLSSAHDDESSADLMQEIRNETEPHLVQYIVSELNQPWETGSMLDDEQKGEVFFVLKTVISSLTRGEPDAK